MTEIIKNKMVIKNIEWRMITMAWPPMAEDQPLRVGKNLKATDSIFLKLCYTPYSESCQINQNHVSFGFVIFAPETHATYDICDLKTAALVEKIK